MEPLEHVEDAFRGTRLYADTVVGDLQQPIFGTLLHAHVDTQRFTTAKLDRVANQILHQPG